jgi:hypothetical protein
LPPFVPACQQSPHPAAERRKIDLPYAILRAVPTLRPSRAGRQSELRHAEQGRGRRMWRVDLDRGVMFGFRARHDASAPILHIGAHKRQDRQQQRHDYSHDHQKVNRHPGGQRSLEEVIHGSQHGVIPQLFMYALMRPVVMKYESLGSCLQGPFGLIQGAIFRTTPGCMRPVSFHAFVETHAPGTASQLHRNLTLSIAGS